MGEAESKCAHVAGVPLLPAIHQYFQQLYLVKGAVATTTIEGNTLTEEEVSLLSERKLQVPPSLEYQKQEVENVLEGFNLIAERMLGGYPKDISVEEIKDHNRLILKNTLLQEDVFPGEIRHHSVEVGGYLGAPSQDCEYLLEKLCAWLNNADGSFTYPPRHKLAYEILKAIVAHLYLAWIHPFGDGNGRTARLVEYRIMLSAGIPAVSAHLLSNHYHQTRAEYYRQLSLSSQAGSPMSFIQYAFEGLVDQLRDQVETIKAQQITVHWHDYVDELFRDRATKVAQRQKMLILRLSEEINPVPVSQMRYLSPWLAEVYAGKNARAIDRDVKELMRMGLVVSTENGYRARKEIILAFLSPVRDGDQQ